MTCSSKEKMFPVAFDNCSNSGMGAFLYGFKAHVKQCFSISSKTKTE